MSLDLSRVRGHRRIAAPRELQEDSQFPAPDPNKPIEEYPKGLTEEVWRKAYTKYHEEGENRLEVHEIDYDPQSPNAGKLKSLVENLAKPADPESLFPDYVYGFNRDMQYNERTNFDFGPLCMNFFAAKFRDGGFYIVAYHFRAEGTGMPPIKADEFYVIGYEKYELSPESFRDAFLKIVNKRIEQVKGLTCLT